MDYDRYSCHCRHRCTYFIHCVAIDVKKVNFSIP